MACQGLPARKWQSHESKPGGAGPKPLLRATLPHSLRRSVPGREPACGLASLPASAQAQGRLPLFSLRGGVFLRSGREAPPAPSSS